MKSEKKLIVLYILQILEKYSDQDHYLTQKQIIDLLEKEYEISEARVRQIDDQVRYQERHKTPYVAEIATACRELEAAKWMNGRIQHALCQGRLNVKNRWRKLTREDMLKLRNIGEKAADIIEYAQKL